MKFLTKEIMATPLRVLVHTLTVEMLQVLDHMLTKRKLVTLATTVTKGRLVMKDNMDIAPIMAVLTDTHIKEGTIRLNMVIETLDLLELIVRMYKPVITETIDTV
jgi:hypothetical protein